MEAISVAAAARALGITEMAVRGAVSRGRIRDASEPGGFALVDLSDVRRFRDERRQAAALRHPDPVAYARSVVDTLHPPTQGYRAYSVRGRDALRLLGEDGVALLGPDVLEAAANQDRFRKGGGCPTCWARMSSDVHQSMPPRDDEATRILLGAPCAKDRAVWAVQATERTRDMVRRRDGQAAHTRQLQRDAARQEFTASQRALQAATERTRAAARRLAAVDPAAAPQRAATAAAGAVSMTARTVTASNRSRFPDWCDCDSETMCARHRQMSAQKGDIRRPGARR